MFRHCRSADDVPHLGGERIVSNLINGESVAFYVPRGKHKLQIDTSWEPVRNPITSGGDTADVTTDAQLESDASITGKQSWTIELIGDRGYMFAFVGEVHKVTKVGWELSSNAPGFETKTQTLPLPPLRATGASWSSFRAAEFPNATDVRTLITNPTNASSPHPLRIGRWQKFGRIDESSIKIHFELTILSDSPSVISATHAETLFVLRKERWIASYLGGGRYGVAKE